MGSTSYTIRVRACVHFGNSAIEAGVAICFPPGALAMGRGGAGQGGVSRSWWGRWGGVLSSTYNAPAENLRLCGAVGVANCFPPNALGWAWWGVVGWGWGGGAGWGVLTRNLAPCQSSTHSHTHLPYLVQLSDNKKTRKTLPRRLLTQGFEASAGTKKLYMIKAY